jgi:hypothetical protein
MDKASLTSSQLPRGSKSAEREAADAACEQDLLGQLLVRSPFEGEGDVQVEVLVALAQVVDTLLGEKAEAEGVHADFEVIVALVDGARLGDERGLAVVAGDPAGEPEHLDVLQKW